MCKVVHNLPLSAHDSGFTALSLPFLVRSTLRGSNNFIWKTILPFWFVICGHSNVISPSFNEAGQGNTRYISNLDSRSIGPRRCSIINLISCHIGRRVGIPGQICCIKYMKQKYSMRWQSSFNIIKGIWKRSNRGGLGREHSLTEKLRVREERGVNGRG